MNGSAYNCHRSKEPFHLTRQRETVHSPKTMRVEGKRLKRTRLIERGRFVVSVEVEMIIPTEDDSEPCYEAETVGFLRQVAEHAESGDVEWLRRHGKVYELVGSR
jgi:hypothetical protein